MKKGKTSRVEESTKVTNEKPISLAGVDLKKLVAAFLQVKPEPSKQKKKPSK